PTDRLPSRPAAASARSLNASTARAVSKASFESGWAPPRVLPDACQALRSPSSDSASLGLFRVDARASDAHSAVALRLFRDTGGTSSELGLPRLEEIKARFAGTSQGPRSR